MDNLAENVVKHTPGPWSVRPDEWTEHRALAIEAECGTIAVIGNDMDVGYDEVDEANARLMCYAPELLAGCTWLLERLMGDSGMGDGYWEQFPEYLAAKEAVRRAGGVNFGPEPSPFAELLAGCQSALRSLESQRKYLSDDRQAEGHNDDARSALESAIAKAEGRS